MKSNLCLIILFTILAFTSQSQTIRYVKVGGEGTSDGSSWANASGDLQAMINASAANDQVWVAAGTYKPTSTTNRSISFTMKNELSILGGFSNTGNPVLNDRNWTTNITILSGDIGAAYNAIDNSYHVIRNENNNLNNSAILDGFTIRDGNADGGGASFNGGGVYNAQSSPSFINCKIVNNNGTTGGAMNNFNNSSPSLTNCAFMNNVSASGGGGVYNSNYCSPILTNCNFQNNYGTNGASIFNLNNCNIVISNCIFKGNNAYTNGGAIFNTGTCSTNVINSTFADNYADNGGALYNSSGCNYILTNCSFGNNSASVSGGGILNLANASVILGNCIVWGNSHGNLISTGTVSVTYSIIEGGYVGVGNLNLDPLFISTSSNNLRLMPCSPALNSGSNTINATSNDLDGNPRLFGSTIDMGAYELQQAALPTIPTPSIATSGATTFCMGGQVTLTSSSTTNNLWSTGDTSQSITVSSSGNYDVVVSYGSSCSISSVPVVVIVNSIPVIPIITASGPTVLCPPSDSVILTSSNSNSYLWSNGSTSQSITVSSSGNYIVTITDLNGCTATSIATPVTIGQYILYVKEGGSGTNDGSSWANASGDFQAMINALCVTEVRVAAGTYKPTTGTDRTISFAMKNGVNILGGFPNAGNPGLADRDWIVNETILSGNIGAVGNVDNSRHVILNTSNDLDSTAILDGFTISDGFSNYLNQSYAAGLANRNSSPTIANCHFINNTSITVGGGMSNFLNSNPTIINCNFSNNSSPGGGGLYNDISSPTIINCNFYNNIGGSFGGGGILNNQESFPIITNCSFTNNANDNYGGGGILNNSGASPVINNCVFIDNSASGGGGITNSFSDATISNCTFTNNSASLYGGAIFNQYCSPFISNCSFNGNFSSAYGGAISNYISTPIVANCNFMGDNGGYGGAMSNEDSSPIVTNCSFNGHTSSYGGAIYNTHNCSTIITNCSFTGSTAYIGDLLYNFDNSTTAFSNCILWGYTEIYNNNTSSTTVNYSIIQGGYPGTSNLDIDPLFVDTANGNLRLMFCSPARDAGNNAANNTSLDLDSNARIFGSAIDMGAYEFQSSSLTPITPIITSLSSATFCPGDSVTLTSSPALSYLWSNGATTQSITVSSSGNYTVSTTDVNGCNVSSFATVVTVTDTVNWYLDEDNDGHYVGGPIINCTSPGMGYNTTANTFGDCDDNNSAAFVIPSPSTASTISNTTFCSGDSILLTGNNDGGIWSNGLTSAAITVTTGGDYFITNSNSCGSVESNHILVLVNTSPIVPVITASGPLTFCTGNTITLNTNGTAANTWSNGSSGNSLIVSQSGIFTTTTTDANGCNSMSTPITVTVDNNPIASTISSNGSTNFCSGNSITLFGNNDGVWSTGDTTSTLTVNSSGDYFVTNTNSCGGVESNHISLTVNPMPITNITLLNNALTADQSNANYQWFDCTNNTIVPNETNQSFIPSVNGNYSVIINLNNCMDTSSCFNFTITNMENLVDNKISIYPNPTLASITITNIQNMHVEISNAIGEIIYNKPKAQNIEMIDLSAISKGIYFVKVAHENGLVIKKIIKE